MPWSSHGMTTNLDATAWATSRLESGVPPVSSREHHPGDEKRDAQKHREGVVVEIAGLQADHVPGYIDDPRRHAVRPKAVDQPAVALLPEEAPERHRRVHQQRVVDLV